MNSLLALTSSVVAVWFSAVWQGCVLVAAVALGLRMVPRLSAAVRSAIWFRLFLMLVALPLLVMLVSGRAAAAPGATAPGATAPAVQLDARWSLAVAAVWLLFSALRTVQLLSAALRLRQLVAEAVDLEPEPAVARLLVRPDGRRVRLCLSETVQRPCVLGFFDPRVLLPVGLMETLSAEELELVLAHEMEHLRRRDDWANLLQKLVLVLLPLHPALVWVEHRLCAERELACDDRAMQRARGPKSYALCLARLAEFSVVRGSLALALGAWERRPELVRRIERIVAHPVRVLDGRTALAVSSVLVVVALGLAAGLMRTPAVVSFTSQSAPVLQARVSENRIPAASPLASLQALPQKEAVPAHRAARPAKVAMAQPELTTAAVEVEPPSLLVLTSVEPFQLPARAVFAGYDERDDLPRVIFAVERVHRTRYAAVPVLGGWIIVQI